MEKKQIPDNVERIVVICGREETSTALYVDYVERPGVRACGWQTSHTLRFFMLEIFGVRVSDDTDWSRTGYYLAPKSHSNPAFQRSDPDPDLVRLFEHGVEL